MNTLQVINGPLTAHAGTYQNGLLLRMRPTDKPLPVGTPLVPTGRTRLQWVEVRTPWNVKNGGTVWVHRDYIGPAAGTTSSDAGRATLVTGLAVDGVTKWARAVEGTRIDADGRYGAQCVDLVKSWGAEHGIDPAEAYGNGKDVAANLGRRPGWRFEPGTATPRPGWIGSWGRPFGVNPRTGEVYGHTAVVVGYASAGRVPVLQQDGFNAATVAYRASLPLAGCVGWAVPPTDPTVPDVVVRPGDTLGGIAERAGTDVATLVKLNALADPDVILVGQVLKVAA